MHVFTYGSLMFPAIWQRVVRGSYRSMPAVLRGYARHAVRGASYPGIVWNRDASVDGVLYCDVEEADLIALDRFEGCEYRRQTVTVGAADGETVSAVTYLFVAEHRLSNAPWQPQDLDIAQFIADHCCP